jgi:hypothetical protein
MVELVVSLCQHKEANAEKEKITTHTVLHLSSTGKRAKHVCFVLITCLYI